MAGRLTVEGPAWRASGPLAAKKACSSARSSRKRVAAQAAALLGGPWPWESLVQDKTIHLVRHGETEMNVFLHECPPGQRYGEPYFKDPLIYDTRLTPEGHRQACAAAAKLLRLRPEPEVVVVSPLTRALQTADGALGTLPWPRLVQPLAAERLYLSSDVGRPRRELERDFPHYSFQELPAGDGMEAAWWYTNGHPSQDLLTVAFEPEDAFQWRVERFRQWLAARPEHSIAVVSHWGVLRELTGRDFYNCEVYSTRLRRLRARPHLVRGEGKEGQRVVAAATGQR